ncbi:PREDICTED: uncharacterized protein LOC104709981 [Camelina sativa]|uniref:Uncharacterized protein LOC104709981 n=1 Tax=Camelina sativa TaxID=90675 RepID=A0ABM0TDL8_CAMSA|nr:PREDICTED: uncharacterized protein LOC104709981 [Camelina sativa]
MEKSTSILVLILFGLLFACVIEATETNLQDETSGGSQRNGPSIRTKQTKPTTVGVKPWSPSQRDSLRNVTKIHSSPTISTKQEDQKLKAQSKNMLPKNVPIPPSRPSRKETPPTPPHRSV